ncbi:MAG: hypothetical protein ACRDY5_03010, partial [Acidimicrobiales bacterium]
LAQTGGMHTSYPPVLLRLHLDGPLAPLWQAGSVTANQVWEAYARYLYLHRLRDVGVLLACVAAGPGSSTVCGRVRGSRWPRPPTPAGPVASWGWPRTAPRIADRWPSAAPTAFRSRRWRYPSLLRRIGRRPRPPRPGRGPDRPGDRGPTSMGWSGPTPR